MRILMLTQYFQPEPIFKGLPLAKALRDRGHEVEVLTGFPNYPGGKLYDGYRLRFWQRETLDGIRVNRVPLYPSHDSSGLRRVANHLSFSFAAGTLGPWLVNKPDVIYLFSLVTPGWVARLMRWWNHSKIVLDVQDLWPESVAGSGMLSNRMLLSVLEGWCRYEYRAPDRVVVLSPGFKKNLIERGVAEEKLDVVYNWCDEDAIVVPPPDHSLARELGLAGRFNVVFAGNMGKMQALETVIEVARRTALTAPDVLFTFVGGGVEVDRLRERAEGLRNVQFLPRRPMSEIGQIFALADALLVHLKDDPLFEITIPSKIQAYLYAGRPILCGVRGDGAELVSRAEAGIAFEPESADSLHAAVLQLRARSEEERIHMGECGRRFYEQQLAFRHGVDRLEQVFHSATNNRFRTDSASSVGHQSGDDDCFAEDSISSLSK